MTDRNQLIGEAYEKITKDLWTMIDFLGDGIYQIVLDILEWKKTIELLDLLGK